MDIFQPAKKYVIKKGIGFYKTWNKSTQYYVHGKDNIPFHTIILPSLLLSYGNGSDNEGLRLPDKIVATEYLTLEGTKISTSKNHAIWINDLIDKYNPDLIRYFFIINSPEKRDADFSFNDFINRNNGELLGAYGNFINRTLVFVKKYFNSKAPLGEYNAEVSHKIENLYKTVGAKIEKGELKDALEEIFEFIRLSNKYYDTEKPWETRTSDEDKCRDTIYTCVQICANLSIILKPFLPFSSEKIQRWLNIEDDWKPTCLKAGSEIKESCILFERIVR